MDWLRDLLEGLTRFSDVGLLLMRVLVAFLFVYSGSGKYRKLGKFAEENGLPVVIAFLAVDVPPHHQMEESLLGGKRRLGVRLDVVHDVPRHRRHRRWHNCDLADLVRGARPCDY